MQKGFTLIEVMIAVAIIGILAAVGILQYQQYIIRTQFNRAVYETSYLRTIVDECLSDGRFNIGSAREECQITTTGSTLIVGNSQSEKTLPPNMGVPQVPKILTSTTNIEATLGYSANSNLKNKKIVWKRTNEGSWICTTNVETKYRTNVCVVDL